MKMFCCGRMYYLHPFAGHALLSSSLVLAAQCSTVYSSSSKSKRHRPTHGITKHGTTFGQTNARTNVLQANIGVGLAGGVAVAVVLILTALFFVHRRKKKNRSPKRDR